MAGLVPAIYVFDADRLEDVDARHKAGHDGSRFMESTRDDVVCAHALLASAPSIMSMVFLSP
jgi:hypothetical protein